MEKCGKSNTSLLISKTYPDTFLNIFLSPESQLLITLNHFKELPRYPVFYYPNRDCKDKGLFAFDARKLKYLLKKKNQLLKTLIINTLRITNCKNNKWKVNSSLTITCKTASLDNV